MKKWIYLITVILGLNQALVSQEENILKIEGKGELEIVPEIMKYTLRVSINSDAQKKSIDNLNQVITNLTKTLTSIGINADSILTESFNVDIMDGRYNPNMETQYIANQQLSFKSSSKSETILSILNAISDLDLPIEISNQAELSKKQNDSLEKNLLSLAFKDAEEKANVIATAGNLKIGGISRVDYGQQFNPFDNDNLALAEVVVTGYKSQSRSFGNYNIPPMKFTKSIIVTYK